MSAAATTVSTSRHGVPFDRLRAHMRRAALVAGLGLLLMAILAGLASFGVLERLVIPGDAAGTASAILDARGIFWLAIIALFGVAVLDVVVALALWMFFDRIHLVVAGIAAFCRALYALIFAVAISHLVSAAQLLSGGQINSSVETEVLADVELFDEIWKLGLALFGCHLLLIGWLAFSSGLVPRFVAVLVAIAGLGYLIDSLAGLLFHVVRIRARLLHLIGEVLFWWPPRLSTHCANDDP